MRTQKSPSQSGPLSLVFTRQQKFFEFSIFTCLVLMEILWFSFSLFINLLVKLSRRAGTMIRFEKETFACAWRKFFNLTNLNKSDSTKFKKQQQISIILDNYDILLSYAVYSTLITNFSANCTFFKPTKILENR
jgi:hypothetical protein